MKSREDGAWRLLFEDINERELKRLFVRPFEAGRDIFTRGTLYRTADISEVRICQTAELAAAARKEYQDETYEAIRRLNRESTVAFISAGSGYRDYEIKDCSTDVTGRYLTRAPDPHDRTALNVFFNNPWVVRIVGGLIVAGVLALAAAMFGGD